tara:strand:- start:475 stop:975 length:501 start_codon:yes stop_codon:yes gene_type:complete
MARQKTNYIVIHCSQTRPSQKIGVKEIDRWHRERGWLKVGYARVIKRDGTVEQGRDDDELQAHVKNYNHISTSVCVVGGAKEENWKLGEDNFTSEEWESLKKVLEELVIKYPEARIVGHYELDERKTCPNFNVREYLLNEDIKGYKFADSTVSDGDIQEMKDAGEL